MNLMQDYVMNFLLTYVFSSQNISFTIIALILYKAINKGIDKVDGRVKDIEGCIIEIQTILRNKYPKLNFERSISKYGQANSPIVLKKEFRGFITESDLDKQIQSKKSDLLDWLKYKKPKTGLDAQDYIASFVISGDIEKYLDLTKYKQSLYEKGKTSQDAQGILGIYLFEVLIPELHLPSNKKKIDKR